MPVNALFVDGFCISLFQLAASLVIYTLLLTHV